MRKIVAGLFVSVDGTAEFANEFIGGYMDAEVGQDMGVQMRERDTILLGANTYREMAPHWPAQDGPMAAQMNDTPKLVVSNSLDSVEEWQNSTLLSGDPVAELTRVKQQPGKNILIVGSLTLTETLLRAGVVDELYILVFPVVFGRGRRLFEVGGEPVALALKECHAFSNGVVKHVYTPAKPEATNASLATSPTANSETAPAVAGAVSELRRSRDHQSKRTIQTRTSEASPITELPTATIDGLVQQGDREHHHDHTRYEPREQ